MKLSDPDVPLSLFLSTPDENDDSSNRINSLYFANVLDCQVENHVVKSPRPIPVSNYLDSLSRNELKQVKSPLTNYLDSLSNLAKPKISSQPSEAPLMNLVEDIAELKVEKRTASGVSQDTSVDANDVLDTNKVLDIDMQNISSYNVKDYEYMVDIKHILHGTRQLLQNSLVHVSFEIQKNTEKALSFVMLKINEVSEEYDLPRKSITVMAAVGDLIENTVKKVSSMN